MGKYIYSNMKKIALIILAVVILASNCFAADNKSVVAIVKVEKNFSKALSKALEMAGDLSLKINKGDRVVLKPYVDKLRKDGKGYVTSSDLIKEMIKIGRKRKGRRFTIAEGVVGGDSYKAFDAAGYSSMAKWQRAVLKSLDSGRYWKSWVQDGNTYKKYIISVNVFQCEFFINMPVLQYDKTSLVSISLKNTMGVIYGKYRKRNLLKEKKLDEIIADVNMIRPCDFTVIDATTVVMKDGKTKKDLGIIIVSSDPVAADAVGAKMLGYDPKEIHHLQIAANKGLGNADMKNIKIVGEKIDRYKKLMEI